MKDKHAILAIALLGGAGLYLLLKKSSGKKNTVETIPQIETEIKANSSDVVPVQEMPRFARPVVMMNYVDVQKNSYFKPKAGAFYR